MIDEPRKSEIEFKDRLSKLLIKYRGRVSKIRMIQFLSEYLDEIQREGVRAV